MGNGLRERWGRHLFFKLNCPKCEIFKKLLTTLCAASVTILTLHCRRGLQLHAPVTYTLSPVSWSPALCQC